MSTEHLSTSTSPSRTRARSRSFGARHLHVDDLAAMGEEPVAFAALNQGSTTDKRELLAFAKERQARYKLPTEVRLIEALPRNAVGKVAKPELRERVKQ